MKKRLSIKPVRGRTTLLFSVTLFSIRTYSAESSCGVAAFVVNSRPHTGACTWVRVRAGLKSRVTPQNERLIGGFEIIVDHKRHHRSSANAAQSGAGPRRRDRGVFQFDFPSKSLLHGARNGITGVEF
jgi:hypothetical protein